MRAFVLRSMALCGAVLTLAGGARADAPAVSLYLDVGRHIAFLATLDGRPKRVCLDTGLGGAPVVASTTAAQLALPVVGSAQVSDPSGGDFVKVATTRLNQVGIGPLALQNVAASLQGALPLPVDCDAIVGLSFFGARTVTIDLAHHRLMVGDTRLLAGSPEVLPLAWDHGVPEVEVTVAGQSQPAHLDTMAQGLSLPAALVNRLHLHGPPRAFAVAHTVNGQFTVTGAQLDDSLRVGPIDYAGSFVEFNPRFPKINLGLSALGGLVMVFDPVNRLVALRGAPPRRKIPVPAG